MKSIQFTAHQYALVILSFAALALFSSPVLAQQVGNPPAIDRCTVESLGGMFCFFQRSTVARIVALVGGIAFLLGLFMFYQALTKLAQFASPQGQQDTITQPLSMLAGGAFLVSFPLTLVIGLQSFGAQNGWNFNILQNPGDTSVSGDDILSMMANFAIDAAGPLATLTMAIAVVIGMILVISALISLPKLNGPGNNQTAGGILAKFIAGIALVNIFWLMSVIGASFGLDASDESYFTGISNSAMAWAGQIDDNTEATERVQIMTRLIFLGLIPFGLIAFVRGILIIKDSVTGARQPAMGSGFTHIIGGVALVNSAPVTCAVVSTFTGSTAMCLT